MNRENITKSQTAHTAPHAVNTSTELAAWRELARLVGKQREMIIAREYEGMPELNRQLAQAFGRASQMRKRAGPPVLRMHSDPQAAELDALQRRVRAAARLNNELILDVLAYVDFFVELLCPQIASPVYDENGQLGNTRFCTAVNRSA